MPSENYDFVPWDSPDDIEKFVPALLAGARALAPKIAGKLGGMKTATGGFLQGAKKKIGDVASKVGIKGGGAATIATEGAASATKTAASAANEAVASAAPKPDLGAKMPTAEVSTPEPPAAEPAVETPEPTEPSGSAGKKNDYKKVGMQLAQQMQAGAAQRKQAQEQRAADMARRGASVQTGEAMDIAWRLLKRDLSEMTDYEIDRARFANDNPELQSEERTRAMDRMAEFARQNVTPFDYGDEVEEAYDDIGDQDHSDYFGEDIDSNELYQYILENAGQEAAQNYVQQYKDARAKYGGNAATMGQLDNYGISNQGDANDFIESRERMTGDMRNIMPNDETVFDAYPYPEGVVYNNKLSPPFTTTPENESNFQMKYTGEPMDIAYQLLKNWEGTTQ